MDASYGMLKNLRPFREDDTTICVRIERLWKVYQLQNTTSSSLNMIFIDKKGDLIHATVPTNLFDTYKDQLQEKKIITLSNFAVEPKIQNYCPLDKPFKIKFEPDTHIGTPNVENNFPKQTFILTDFSNFRNQIGQTAQLIDVAGLFIEVQKNGTYFKTRSGEIQKNDLCIPNERGEEIRISFWGKAHEILIPLFTAPKQQTNLIVTSLIVKKFIDDMYLQATNATKIYINYKFEQPDAIQKLPETKKSGKGHIEDTKNIAAIIILSKQTKQIYLQEGFYYQACANTTCKAGVHQHHHSNWCCSCNNFVEKPKLKFRISLQISDGFGQKDVTAFDETGKKLIGKYFHGLININSEVADNMVIKEAADKILGKQLKFEINIADFNLQHPELPFTITNFFSAA